jgi:hypothetical protein
LIDSGGRRQAAHDEVQAGIVNMDAESEDDTESNAMEDESFVFLNFPPKYESTILPRLLVFSSSPNCV